jgi:hypothetical protein
MIYNILTLATYVKIDILYVKRDLLSMKRDPLTPAYVAAAISKQLSPSSSQHLSR